MAETEFLLVDVGAEEAKVGGTLTVLAVAKSESEAEQKAQSLDLKHRYIALLERKAFWRLTAKVELTPVGKGLFEKKAG